ncbi:MAG: hypothetical protein IMY85_01385 [Chloroflexi bacterium]|nr:hypothetical protein [Chloroflexota bacterium]
MRGEISIDKIKCKEERSIQLITGEQLLEVFAAYNQQIWPMPVVVYLLGISGLFLAVRKTAYSSRVIPAILAFFWLWVALMFWLPSGLQGFSPGYIFAALFLIQGVLFLVYALKPKLFFGFKKDAYSFAGIVFALYALVGYPLFSALLGHIYPRTPIFGLTPCPVIAYTFGLLLLTERKVPKVTLIIPFFYALSGFLWISIGMVEDIGMLVSGLLGAWLIWIRDARRASVPSESVPEPEPGAAWSLDLLDKD